MRWHCPSVSRPRKRGTRTGLFGLPVFGKPARASKSHRMNQEDEVYINLFYPTRIIKTVRERNMEENLKGPGINLIRKVARELYEKEDEETRAIVRAKLASLKKVEESDEEEEELEAGSPTPGQYQESVCRLLLTSQACADCIAEPSTHSHHTSKISYRRLHD